MRKYYIDYNTGAGNEYAETLEEAKALADEGACYTQQSIHIYEVESETDNDIDYDYYETPRQPVAIRNWYGVAYDEEEAYEENPICFGDFGYYGDWVEL